MSNGNVRFPEKQIFDVLYFNCTNEIIKILLLDPRDTKMDQHPI